MATDVVMPRLSDSMEEGTVLKWLVEVLAREGDTLAVGEPIARVGAAGEEPAQASGSDAEPGPAEIEADAGPAEPAAPAQPQSPRPVAPPNGGERIKASPLARRMAGELGVELAEVEGSGPGGRVVKADVEAASKATKPAAAEALTVEPAAEARSQPAPAASPDGAKGETTVRELSRLQRTVSRRMAESKATVPDFSLELTVDMTLCIELRERLKGQTEQPPSYNDMVVKAAALALRDHPRVNGAYRDGRFETYSRVNVGLAVAANDALVVPVVHDADQKSLGEISRQARRLIERVRDGEITPPEVSGGTFTVSNLGMLGIERFTAIVNPPQAAILTVGALARKPAVDDRGRVVARNLMTLTLVCDHRILYGADGAAYLAQVGEALEQPLALAL
jgi:pyruvate dehydrogenase E2 component (dihydrolipoamide acetyltransferase)